MRVVSGHVVLSDQMFRQVVQAEDAWRELEWIALHYEEATPEQRARLDRYLEAVDRAEEWDDDE